jgi:hypothetical protein
MKTLIQVVLVAVVVGGLSASGSFFLMPKPAAKPAETDTAKTDPATKTDEGSEHAANDAGHDAKSEDAKLDVPLQEKTPAPLPESEHSLPKTVVELPVAVRPPYVPDSDESGSLIAALRQRALTAEETELALANRHAGMKLIFDDLRAEQALAAKMRQRVLGELASAKRYVEETLKTTDAEREAAQRTVSETKSAMETALATAKSELDSLQKQIEELKTSQVDFDNIKKKAEELQASQADYDTLKKQFEQLRAEYSDYDSVKKRLSTLRPSSSTASQGDDSSDTSGLPTESSNLKKLTAVYDAMPPENVATVCQQLVKKGKTGAVVALLDGMKERQSAKVLTNIADTDPTLAADLTERLKKLKATAKSMTE